ncbi:pentapeptide repeat-containing protein [Sediminispirochaeta bajacaliforniensis]|uniref:pentapeptide repeat-containing protein n=1 Tax=Sediminispirochaeta bajacaliforniensis TaxID=148 RepID=UPI0003709BFA|nr:pentapeptide repeat-containing protein [Sediminispirochaeta bajacaliforniensis]
MPVYSAHAGPLFTEHLASGKPLDDVQLNGMDLTGWNFAGRAFTGLSVRRSILDRADFGGARIHESVVEESNLKDVRFDGALLEETSFSSCVLMRSSFRGSRMEGGSFRGSYMQRLLFSSAVFSGTLFMNVEAALSEVRESVFYDCHFRFDDTGGITGFQESSFHNCLFIGCTMEGFALTGVDLTGTVFIDSRFRIPDWEDTEIGEASFIGCSGLPLWLRRGECSMKELTAREEAAVFIASTGGAA